ncbi:hypothetical protein ACFOJ6_06590 [Gordonia humi]|uniref:hypothetical protein n=1 Tax=Gordonia humi TaxID=686429 RepID=UPI00361B18EB
MATTRRNNAVATAAHHVVRLVGTASAFQIPPSPSAVPNEPRPGSARRAKAAAPPDDPEAFETAAATSHGDEASTQPTAPISVMRTPGRAATAVTAATTNARIDPVGVKPAAANKPVSMAIRRHDRSSARPSTVRTIGPSVA